MRAFSLVTIASVLSGAALVTPLTGSVPAAQAAAPDEAPSHTVDEAIAKAHRTGTPIEAIGAATETTTVTANPDGTIAFSQTATPTRKKVDGTWQNLDATLIRNADGTWSPTLSDAPLTLSGGGTTPMAVMGAGTLSATIDAPMDLPEPTVAADTATYPEVLPGVDLQVKAQTSGGFSEVFVVRDAAAATNPALATLALPVTTKGLTLKTDKAGNLHGADRAGRRVLTAAAPTMWDSTPTTKPTRADTTGLLRDATSGQPATSTLIGPGAGAKTARIGTTVGSGRLTLTPNKSLLTGAKTKFPVFIDPSFEWQKAAGTIGGWATLPKDFPSTNYWKDTPDPRGRMQAGYSGSILSRTLINFSIPVPTLTDATIESAQLKITQTWAYSCNATRVNVYAPAATLTSANATWNAWDDKPLGPVVAHATAANGYNSSCPSEGVPFDVKSTILDNIKPTKNKKIQTFVLKANDESATSGWKEFLETSPTLAILYNHTPNKPSGLHTAPITSCTAGDAVGEGPVSLYANVSDPDGGSVSVKFKVWQSGSSALLVDPAKSEDLYVTSRSEAVLRLTRDQLNKITDEGGNSKIYWQAQTSDYRVTSAWSATCNFVYDRTRPSAPQIDPVAEGAYAIGESVTLHVKPPATGIIPTKYLYQLNGGPYGSIDATAGAGEITVIPDRFTNTVTVSGLSAGGNVGGDAATSFNANPAETAADADLDGDNLADLVTVGGGHSIATGLWLASGKGDGRIAPAAANIGSHGNGIAAPGTVGSPTNFTGGQPITGHFGGTGLQDILVYYPNDPNNPGGAVIMRGNGDGSTIPAERSGNYHAINTGTFSFTDLDGVQTINNPTQIANAGAHTTTTYPDLIGIAGVNDGTFLTYYPNNGTIGGYGNIVPLLNTTPTGGTDWNTWTITTAQTNTTDQTGTDTTSLFLHQASTGKLYLWNNATYNTTTARLEYTQYRLSNDFNTGGNTLQAAYINTDHTADLWSIGDGATATAWLVTGLDATAATATITAQPRQKVLTGTHAWMLNDHTDEDPEDNVPLDVDASHTAQDSIGTIDATATTATRTAIWNSGDLYDPDVKLSKGALATKPKSPAITTNANFTVDVWVKPTEHGGTVLSQDGTNTAGFRLWADAATKSWRFGMPSSDKTDSTWAIAAAPADSVKLGTWTHLTASFTKATGVLDLHVNGKDVATAVQLTSWAATDAFRMGADRQAGTVGNYLTGQLAEVLTFNQVVIYDDGNDAVRDFDGDLHSDVFAIRSTGQLYLYRGNGGGQFKAANGAIGSGWTNFTATASPGDFNGDGFIDVIARKTDGTLLLYRGNGAGDWLNGTKPDAIGSGLNNFINFFSPGDFNGDGKTDVISRKTDGTLLLYRGNGTGGWLNGATPDNIGSGWNNFTSFFSPGDFNGDAKTDVITRKTDGTLLLYRGNGTGGWTNGATPDIIGRGWNNFDAIFSAGDFNGDAKTDVIARKPDGTLLLYRGNGTGGWTNGTTPDTIGKGWGTFTSLM